MAGDKRKQVTKSGRRNWIIGSGIIIILFILAIMGVVRFFWVGSADEIVSVANQFKPQSGWKLTSEHIEPPRTWCIDVKCPSISRRWETHTPLTYDEFSTLLKQQGWNFAINGDCLVDPNDYADLTSICDATGLINEYKATLTIRTSDRGMRGFVGLAVERASK